METKNKQQIENKQKNEKDDQISNTSIDSIYILKKKTLYIMVYIYIYY